jgi:hypothetical protein
MCVKDFEQLDNLWNHIYSEEAVAQRAKLSHQEECQGKERKGTGQENQGLPAENTNPLSSFAQPSQFQETIHPFQNQQTTIAELQQRIRLQKQQHCLAGVTTRQIQQQHMQFLPTIHPQPPLQCQHGIFQTNQCSQNCARIAPVLPQPNLAATEASQKEHAQQQKSSRQEFRERQNPEPSSFVHKSPQQHYVTLATNQSRNYGPGLSSTSNSGESLLKSCRIIARRASPHGQSVESFCRRLNYVLLPEMPLSITVWGGVVNPHVIVYFPSHECAERGLNNLNKNRQVNSPLCGKCGADTTQQFCDEGWRFQLLDDTVLDENTANGVENNKENLTNLSQRPASTTAPATGYPNNQSGPGGPYVVTIKDFPPGTTLQKLKEVVLDGSDQSIGSRFITPRMAEFMFRSKDIADAWVQRHNGKALIMNYKLNFGLYSWESAGTTNPAPSALPSQPPPNFGFPHSLPPPSLPPPLPPGAQLHKSTPRISLSPGWIGRPPQPVLCRPTSLSNPTLPPVNSAVKSPAVYTLGVVIKTTTTKNGETTTVVHKDPHFELENRFEVTTVTVKNGDEVRTTTSANMIPKRNEKEQEKTKESGENEKKKDDVNMDEEEDDIYND